MVKGGVRSQVKYLWSCTDVASYPGPSGERRPFSPEGPGYEASTDGDGLG